MRTFEFDTRRHPLQRCVERMMGTTDLGIIHHYVEVPFPVFARENDQSTPFHRRFYQRFADDFAEHYDAFVRGVIRPLYDEPVAYQRVPTFRVHLPGNVAVGEFHRDRDYHHSDVEMNYWVPLTGCWGTNTLWVESEPDRGDYQPVELAYGQIFVFDGVNLRHGNKINGTNHTRVSMDLRIVPMSRYQDSDRETINTKMRFALGGYFAHCP